MKITDQAIEQFKAAITNFEKPVAGIRLMSGSGCCGPKVEMSLEEMAFPGDKLIQINGVDFFLEPNAEGLLSNVTIDFRENGFRLDGLNGGGCCG